MQYEAGQSYLITDKVRYGWRNRLISVLTRVLSGVLLVWLTRCLGLSCVRQALDPEKYFIVTFALFSNGEVRATLVMEIPAGEELFTDEGVVP